MPKERIHIETQETFGYRIEDPAQHSLVPIEQETVQETPPPTYIDPYSNEVDEILSYVPNWLIRWGITVILIGVLMMLAMSWWIKYPDVVKGRVKIMAANPPAIIVTRAAGAISLLKSEKAQVNEGDIIAYIKNPASRDDVEELKKILSDIQPKLSNPSSLRSYPLPRNLNLGELGTDYTNLINSFQKTKQTNNTAGQNQNRKNFIQQQITEYQGLIQNVRGQIRQLEQEYNNRMSMLQNRYRPLFNRGAISKVELEQKEDEVKQLQREITTLQGNINQNNNQILSLQREMRELDFQRDDEVIIVQNDAELHYNNLINNIHLWEQRYIIKAPIKGEVSFANYSKNNMYVKMEQEIAGIVPPKSESIHAEMTIAEFGSGKVEVGQRVNIVLDSYLKKEFGSVKGEVADLAPVSTNDAFTVKVDLPKGLTTNFNKKLPFRHDMQGTGEIITKDVRLIHRIFNELKVALDFDS